MTARNGRHGSGAAAVVAVALGLAGCGSDTDRPAPTSAGAPVPALEAAGVAILTPTAGFGQEENRQSLAQVFGELMAERRPELEGVPLAQALSRINAAGLAETYDRLYVTYRNTGLFDRDLLRAVGGAVGARYLVQLKLQSFEHNAKSRFAWFGISILQTQTARAWLFVQVWDAADGRIVWENSAETVRQSESVRERALGLQETLKAAAAGLVDRLPPARRAAAANP